MTRILILLSLAATLLLATACKTNQGSREFIPGRGWVPTR
jgi:predicted small secreted protein